MASNLLAMAVPLISGISRSRPDLDGFLVGCAAAGKPDSKNLSLHDRDCLSDVTFCILLWSNSKVDSNAFYCLGVAFYSVSVNACCHV